MQIEGGEAARPTRDKILTKACDHVPAYLCLFSARHPNSVPTWVQSTLLPCFLLGSLIQSKE